MTCFSSKMEYETCMSVVSNVKVIPNEACVKQHHMLVCDELPGAPPMVQSLRSTVPWRKEANMAEAKGAKTVRLLVHLAL